jgi:glycosyltransferase involved in cell wall biosynthesis
LYPARLYPGELTVPGGAPDLPPFPGAAAVLRWDRPGSWWAVGRRARTADLLVLVCVVPAQVPALLTIAKAARLTRGSAAPRVVAIVHNVAPHEAHPGAQALIKALLGAVDTAMVHSVEQAELARGRGGHDTVQAALPPHLPGGRPDPVERASAVTNRLARSESGEPIRVLALGLVRDYKGFDLLLTAAAAVERIQVTIAGELWGAAGEAVMAAAADPRLKGRVEVKAGYLPGSAVAGLCAEHDVLALPYRSATGSQNVQLAQAHGLPVLASDLVPFSDEVRDGLDGLLVRPGEVATLVDALERLTAPGLLSALITNVPEVAPDGPWRHYLDVLLRSGS